MSDTTPTSAQRAKVGCATQFLSNLQLALIILKLCGVLDWTWAAVFLPLLVWVTAILMALFILSLSKEKK